MHDRSAGGDIEHLPTGTGRDSRPAHLDDEDKNLDATSARHVVKHAYAWPEQKLTFEADERVDRELFHLCSEAWGFLDTTLAGLKIDRNDLAFASKLILIYLAVRVQGVTTAGAMLVTQRLGREAISMGRCQYDYYLRMLYYDAYHVKADDVIRLLDAGAYDFEFWKKSDLDVRSRWSKEDVKKLEALIVNIKEPNFTYDVKNGLRNDLVFHASIQEGNSFAKWFFANIDETFRTHWKYGSSIVHASPLDMVNVVMPLSDGNFMINVDSRMKAPNKTIADLSQRCMSAMCIIRWRFGLEFAEEHISWSSRFQKVAERHGDEPTDVRSMHD